MSLYSLKRCIKVAANLVRSLPNEAIMNILAKYYPQTCPMLYIGLTFPLKPNAVSFNIRLICYYTDKCWYEIFCNLVGCLLVWIFTYDKVSRKTLRHIFCQLTLNITSLPERHIDN